jgi:predicted SAM-dependent methyltransferase
VGDSVPRSIDRILAEHVVEHWTTDELAAFCAAVGPRLAPDGFVRLAVPDGNHPDPAYREAVRPGGSGAGADDHKVLYTAASLREALDRAGFACDVVECFSEGGTFQRSEWDAADGLVRRSARFDPRNAGEPLAYTSLIVDCRPRASGGVSR